LNKRKYLKKKLIILMLIEMLDFQFYLWKKN